MTDQADQDPRPLWARGDMMFRVAGGGAETDRLVKVSRPFALVGRARTADVAIQDRAVSGSHAYLHLDLRGVYVVDLVTRTGTRINGTDQGAGWLRPGDRIEVAGRRIELLRIRRDGTPFDPPPCSADLLADSERPDLPQVTLEPLQSGDPPWALGSELIFLGWSASCGIQVRDPAVSRTHCALVRAPAGAFLVDLGNQNTWVEDRPVRGAEALHDGDLITIGSTQFTIRIGRGSSLPPPATIPTPLPTALAAFQTIATTPARVAAPVEIVPSFPAFANGHIPAEARDAILAWIVGAIQGGQRQQGEFQIAVTDALRQIQQDSSALLSAHLARIEKIDREIAGLRAELERRNALPTPPIPQVEPLRIPRPSPTSPPPGPESRASTAWLLERVGQLENENRSAWKDLLARVSPSKNPS